VGGFDNESFALLFVELLFQVIRILGQKPGFGKK